MRRFNQTHSSLVPEGTDLIRGEFNHLLLNLYQILTPTANPKALGGCKRHNLALNLGRCPCHDYGA